MSPKDYIVVNISGEYATLENIDDKSEVFIALALLPLNTNIDTKLHWENFTYTIFE